MAVSLLVEPFLSTEQRERSRPAATTALAEMAKAHSKGAFFQLASVAGPDAETAPVGTQALSRLEVLSRDGTLRFPGALLRETLVRHLSAEDFRDFGLSTAVEVVLDIDVERYLERVLNEPGEAERRVAVVRTLAGQLARAGWLALSAGALRRCRRADGSEADRSMAVQRSPRGQRLWSGGTVFPGWGSGRRPHSRTSRGRGFRGRGRGAGALRGDGAE
jgi:hypothetical protein